MKAIALNWAAPGDARGPEHHLNSAHPDYKRFVALAHGVAIETLLEARVKRGLAWRVHTEDEEPGRVPWRRQQHAVIALAKGDRCYLWFVRRWTSRELTPVRAIAASTAPEAMRGLVDARGRNSAIRRERILAEKVAPAWDLLEERAILPFYTGPYLTASFHPAVAAFLPDFGPIADCLMDGPDHRVGDALVRLGLHPALCCEVLAGAELSDRAFAALG